MLVEFYNKTADQISFPWGFVKRMSHLMALSRISVELRGKELKVRRKLSPLPSRNLLRVSWLLMLIRAKWQLLFWAHLS